MCVETGPFELPTSPSAGKLPGCTRPGGASTPQLRRRRIRGASGDSYTDGHIGTLETQAKCNVPIRMRRQLQEKQRIGTLGWKEENELFIFIKYISNVSNV